VIIQHIYLHLFREKITRDKTGYRSIFPAAAPAVEAVHVVVRVDALAARGGKRP